MPWFTLPERDDIAPNVQGYEMTIKSRLGDFPLWHVTWEQDNWMKIRASKDWVYIAQMPATGEAADTDAQIDAEPPLSDGDHIVFFPMDREGLCPRAWFEAAWPFFEHFRSNFCFYPQEAFMYRKVTLIGHPLTTRFGVAQEIEDALEAEDWRQVERIWCTSAKELAEVLQRRVEEKVRFRGEDELAPEADLG